MDAKLTLSLNEEIILQGKAFAKRNHTSLSQLVENFLAGLTLNEQESKSPEISPLVKSLSGVLTLPDDFNHNEERIKYLEEKYK